MTFKVELRQAGRAIAVPEGRTILDVALAEEIAYPHGCRSGRCGSCKSRLVAGEVDLLEHTRFALSDEEKAQGLILACRALPKSDAFVAWLGGDDELSDHPRRRLRCRVVGIEDATHDIKRVRLAVEDGAPLTFSAGQYARVTFPAAPPRGYSMASWSGETELEFHIRRIPGGAATARIHARLKLGDQVAVDGPLGSSYLREKHAGPILCIAGGSGLAPIKSVVETPLAHGMKQPIHIYFGARTERDLYRWAISRGSRHGTRTSPLRRPIPKLRRNQNGGPASSPMPSLRICTISTVGKPMSHHGRRGNGGDHIARAAPAGPPCGRVLYARRGRRGLNPGGASAISLEGEDR